MTEVMAGAEAFRADGGPVGVLVLHGFTADPSSVRGLAEAFADAGYSVESPRLPGHGTSVSDLMTTDWSDWSAAAEESLTVLTAHTRAQFVTGLSMGGFLACWLAARHADIAGLVCINPVVTSTPDQRELLRELIATGERVLEGNGSDIADPDVVDSAYLQTPLVPLLSLLEATERFGADLGLIRQPLLLMNSPHDHVVPPSDSDHLVSAVSGPVERVTLERSFHVATRDHDRDLIAERALEFVARVATAM